MTNTKILKNLISFAIIVSVAFFFYKSFQNNQAAFQSHALTLHYFFLILSFVFVLATYFLATYGWQIAINALSGVRPMSFAQSVAVVNTSSLVKYIPGKIWSYALQMYWLADTGIPKSVIVYVNLVNLFISIITTLIVGLCYALFSPSNVPVQVLFSLLLLVVLFDMVFIQFNAPVTHGMISLVNRVFKRDIACLSVSHRLVLQLHLIHFAAALSFGISSYLLCYGIGFEIGPGKAWLVMSSLLLSDVIGFLAVIVPGGLGVREGIMYLMLNGVSTVSLSLILPVASRLVGMLSDITIGLTAFALLKYRFTARTFDGNARAAK